MTCTNTSLLNTLSLMWTSVICAGRLAVDGCSRLGDVRSEDKRRDLAVAARDRRARSGGRRDAVLVIVVRKAIEGAGRDWAVRDWESKVGVGCAILFRPQWRGRLLE